MVFSLRSNNAVVAARFFGLAGLCSLALAGCRDLELPEAYTEIPEFELLDRTAFGGETIRLGLDPPPPSWLTASVAFADTVAEDVATTEIGFDIRVPRGAGTGPLTITTVRWSAQTEIDFVYLGAGTIYPAPVSRSRPLHGQPSRIAAAGGIAAVALQGTGSIALVNLLDRRIIPFPARDRIVAGPVGAPDENTVAYLADAGDTVVVVDLDGGVLTDNVRERCALALSTTAELVVLGTAGRGVALVAGGEQAVILTLDPACNEGATHGLGITATSAVFGAGDRLLLGDPDLRLVLLLDASTGSEVARATCAGSPVAAVYDAGQDRFLVLERSEPRLSLFAGADLATPAPPDDGVDLARGAEALALAPDGRVWLAGSEMRRVTILDPVAPYPEVSVPVAATPTGIIVAGDTAVITDIDGDVLRGLAVAADGLPTWSARVLSGFGDLVFLDDTEKVVMPMAGASRLVSCDVAGRCETLYVGGALGPAVARAPDNRVVVTRRVGAGPGDTELLAVDLAQPAIEVIGSLPDHPMSLAIGPNGTVAAANGDELSIFAPPSPVATINLSEPPAALTSGLELSGQDIFLVTLPQAEELLFVSAAGVEATWNLGYAPGAVSYSSYGDIVAVTSGDQIWIHAATGAVVASATLAGAAVDIVLSPDGALVYGALPAEHLIVGVDTVTGQVERLITDIEAPAAITSSVDGGRLFVVPETTAQFFVVE